MKARSVCIVFVIMTIIASAQGQYLPMPEALKQEISHTRDFYAIMEKVNAYYETNNFRENKQLTSEYKKWNRWAWFAIRHLDEKNEVNYQSQFLFEEGQRLSKALPEQNERSNSGVWSFVGPTTTTWANNVGSKGLGRVDRLAFNPANGNDIVAATPAGGLWRSFDGGQSWFSISGNIPNCGISGIVISSDDPYGNKIYILTGDADSGNGGFVNAYLYQRTSIGVLVTYNGGATWQIAGNSASQFAGRRGYKLLQVRGTPSRFLAVTDSGLYRSDNFGNTWTLSQYAGSTFYDIEQHPTDDAILYISAINTAIKSVDNGISFNAFPVFNPAASNCNRSALAVTPDEPNEVYFLQCGPGYNRLYQSTDSGDNYTSINSTDLVTGQYTYNCAIAIHPLDNNLMAVGGVILSSSTDNGDNFGNVTVGIVQNVPVPSNYLHPDVHDLVYSPNNNLLYAATDGGVFVSFDNGVNWEERSNGLSCTQYYHMDGFDGTPSLFIGGAQDNGTAYTTNGSNMAYCGSADGFSVDFACADNNVFYMVENTQIFRFRRSTNTRVNVSPGTSTDQTFYPNIITHPTNSSSVYAGYQNSIWRSDDQGNNWINISGIGSSNNGGGHTGGLAVTAAAPNRIYAANANTIRRSDDQGGNWIPISGNPGWPANFGVITDLACRNANPDELWVAMTGPNGMNKVFYTSNAGASWINFTGTLPNVPVFSIAYSEEGDTYVGTELGVYFMDFSMTDWVPFYNGLPQVPVSDVFINEDLGQIQAGTFGRGIWQSDLYDDCGPFLLLGGTTEGKNFYQSNGFIETSQFIPGSVGNELRLRSPVRIIFETGFRINQGAYMHGIIGNCGQGVFNMSGNPVDHVMTKASRLSMAFQED